MQGQLSAEGCGSISLVIPCYNEESSIDSLKRRLLPVIETFRARYEAQLVFIDDGSTDSTYAKLIQSFTTLASARTIILRHASNRGIGAAMRTGFKAAAGDIICTLDSDGTYDPARMPDMVEMLVRENMDIVTGSPYHPLGTVYNVKPRRLVLSKTASRMYSYLVPTKLYCYTSFFRAYRREWARPEFSTSDGFLAVTETLLSAAHAGARIAEFPTSLGARVSGESKMKAAKVTLDHLRLMSRTAVFNKVLGNGVGLAPVRDHTASIPTGNAEAKGELFADRPMPVSLLGRWTLVGRTGRPAQRPGLSRPEVVPTST